MIAGLELAGVVVLVVWAALSLVTDRPGPLVEPATAPSAASAARPTFPALDPADAEERLRAHSVHGSVSFLMGGSRISMVVPATPAGDPPNDRGGWTRYGSSYLSKDVVGSQTAEAVFYWTPLPGGGWADRCPGLVTDSTGPSAADLAAAFSAVPGVALVSGPSSVSVGGSAAQHLVFTVREDLGCDPGYFYAWQAVAGGPFWAETEAGDTIRVWLVEREGGTPLFIAGETTTDAGPGLEQEIERIVESIRFD